MQINQPSASLPQQFSNPVLDPKKEQPSWKTSIYNLFHHIHHNLSHCISYLKMPKIFVAIPNKIQEKISLIASFLVPCKPLTKLPRDPALITKKLDNGLTYYVRKNNHPFPKKACLRLVVRVGMLNETTQEKGIAHLIEHIVQMETEHFPKDQIMTYLNSKGVHWARDNNAYTAPEETVYKLDIPLDDPEALEHCLFILSEVASKAVLSPSIINNEREIIVDELSQKRSAWTRYANAKHRITCEGSPYAHLVDRDKEIKSVRECPADVIQNFYKRWYQPENIAVIAVGDFDPKTTSSLIEKHFGKIPKSNDAPSVHHYPLKENPGSRFLCFSDPEIIYSVVEIFHQLPKLKYANEIEMQRMSLVIDMFKNILNDRMDNLAEEENSPFVETNCSQNDIIPDHPYFKLNAIAKEGQIPQAFRQLLLEIKRIKTHGFLQSEFDRLKKAYLAKFDHAIQEKGKITYKSFINLYHSHFIDHTVAADIDKMIHIKKQLLKKITLKDLNALASYLLPDSNRLISTAMPEKPGIELMTEDLLKKEITFAETENVKPLVDEFINTPLIKQLPKSEKIHSTKLHKRAKIIEYSLKNGMKVLFKPTKFKNDEVSLKAYSLNGTRNMPIKDLISAKFSNDFFDACGIGDFDNKTLNKVLNGKRVSFSTSVGNYTTTIKAASVLKDIETAFQLVHLMFTSPGYDSAAFNRALKNTEEIYRNQQNNPSKAFSKEIIKTITQNHPEFQPIDFEDLKSIDYETCKNFHRKKFSNPADFTVAIVGNIQTHKVKALVERYFASLPKTGEKQAIPNYSSVSFPPGITQKTVYAGKESHGTSLFTFPAPISDNLRERLLSTWCCDILEMRLTKVLRFQSGKTYSQSCTFANNSIPGLNPKTPSSAMISFTGDPAVQQTLKELLLEQIQDLQTNGPTEAEVNDYKKNISHEYSNGLKTNSTWIDIILSSSIWNRELDHFDAHEKALESLTPTEAKEHFKKIFNLDNYAVVTLFPKPDHIF